ncbi:MAG: UDP-N-acetylmuramate dehydrogenase [Saprospiraceae bacterium]|nr:UDP-N-acetylmuramate dehydrogenase [Saprospiraceae bacterium]
MKIEKQVSLTDYNSFGIGVIAENLARISKVADIQEIVAHYPDKPKLVLGGGSNCLFISNPLSSLLLKNEILGIELVDQDETYTTIKVGGGENWHELVLWCVQRGLGGIENLSLIPGTVGAAPIQNIGAYGVELKDVFQQLEAIDLTTGHATRFAHEDCQFGYRSSVFKTKLKGKVLIANVYLKLKHRNHSLNTSYGAINGYLEEQGIGEPTIKDVSEAVIAIRTSKLPDPGKIGNAGSFFKNPEIPKAQFLDLQKKFPNIVHYPGSDGLIKVPAGWLIDQCGWKGKRFGAVGCYAHQALVIVNYGGATGQEILAHAERVAESVLDTYGIQLTPEVNIISS